MTGVRSGVTRADKEGVAVGETASRMTKRPGSTTTKEKTQKPTRETASLLPKENPLSQAGLSTKLAVTIILVPLISQFLGRSMLPWYVGNGEDALERTIDVLGNVCFLLGVTVSIIIVMSFRKI